MLFIRQGQASCYEGSGRAPPLGPPPSVDRPAAPPTHKEGAGTSQILHILGKASFVHEIYLLLQSHLVIFPPKTCTLLIQKLHPTSNMQSSRRTTMCPTVTPATFKEPRACAQVSFLKLFLSPSPSLSQTLTLTFGSGRRQAVPL